MRKTPINRWAKSWHTPERVEIERLRSKIMGVSSQIEALSERLSELPKEVSAAPIYRQLERLQQVKVDHDLTIDNLKSGGQAGLDRVVGLDTFSEFARHYRAIVRELHVYGTAVPVHSRDSCTS